MSQTAYSLAQYEIPYDEYRKECGLYGVEPLSLDVWSMENYKARWAAHEHEVIDRRGNCIECGMTIW